MTLYADLDYYRQNPSLYSINPSPDGKLATVKYVHMGMDWTDERALMARGLVVEQATGKIVAKPYDKFFNYGQILSTKEAERLSQWPKSKSFEVSEKLDGSLGIVYTYNDKLYISSTGTVEPIYSWVDRARTIFSSDTMNKLKELGKTYTMLFEILDPEYVIVIPAEKFDMKLHGMTETATGRDLSRQEMRDVLADAMIDDIDLSPAYTNLKSLSDVLEAIDNLKNKEGFVVRFDDGFRLKFKTEDYVAIHRSTSLFSSVTRVSVEMWLALEELGDLDDYLASAHGMMGYNPEIVNELRRFEKTIAKFWSLVDKAKGYVNQEMSRKELFDSKNLTAYFDDNADTGRMITAALLTKKPLLLLQYSYVIAEMTGKKRDRYQKQNRDNLIQKVKSVTGKTLVSF